MIYGRDNYKLKIERLPIKDTEFACLNITNSHNESIVEIDIDEFGALQIINELSEMLKIKHASD
jgi:hypothetical protein